MSKPTCTKCAADLEVGQEVIETIVITDLRDDYIPGYAIPGKGFNYRHVECPENKPKFETVDNRDPACVEAWPECASFEYDPRCCRFPKNCSAGNTWAKQVEDPDDRVHDSSNRESSSSENNDSDAPGVRSN